MNKKAPLSGRIEVMAGIFGVLAIACLIFTDKFFYFRNILNNDITLVFPLPYAALTMLLVYSYSSATGERMSRILYPVIAMAIIFSLLYLVTDLKISMIAKNPLGGNRGIFNLYANLYYFSIMAIFAVILGIQFRSPGPAIFRMPLSILFAWIESVLLLNRLIPAAAAFLIFFTCSLKIKKVETLARRALESARLFVTNERLFLMAIFILAFAIRSFWGMRVLSITGANFPAASDDGLTYDPFAAILAGGGKIPVSKVFYWSGFGYWYFLAAVYKLFGLHNFKAAIIIQSFIGAAVPVLTYYIGRKVFKSKFVACIAALATTLDMTLIFLSAVMGMEALYIPILIAAMAFGTYFLLGKKITYTNSFIFGGILGIANCVRSEVLFFPLIAAAIICLFKKNAVSLRRMTFIIAIFLIGFILFMSVQHIINFMTYGSFRLTSGALADTYLGNYGTNENDILDSRGFNPFANLERAKWVFLSHPIGIGSLIAKGFLKRLVIYYLKPNFGVFDPVFLINPASGYFFKFAVWVDLYRYLFILVGIFWIFRKKVNLTINIIFLSFAIFVSSMYAFVWVTNARHRGVMIPFGALFGAYGLYVFYQKVKSGKEILK